MTTDLDADIVIGGVTYSQYLMSLERQENLNKPGSEVTLVFSPDFPHASIDPWDSLTVSEQGTLTLTGYVSHIIPSREPKKVTVKGMDTYKRALEWFTPENIYTSGSLTVDYWAGYFCDEAGLAYVIDTPSGIVLTDNVPFGLKSVDDILTEFCGIAQWTMIVDASGVLHFQHINRPSSGDYQLSNVQTFEHDTNDTDTRNVAKIWGFQRETGGSLFYQYSRPVTGVTGDRIMVFADPDINTAAKARSLAKAALDQWARLDNLLAIDLLGDPSRRVGQSASYYHEMLTSGSYMDTITDAKSVLSGGGYNQSLTLGRRAYRYPHFPVGHPPPIGEIIWEDETSGSSGYVQRIRYYDGYVYLIGNNTNSGVITYRIEKRDVLDGRVVWTRDYSLASSSSVRGIDIIVDGSGGYLSIRSFSIFLSSFFDSVYRFNVEDGSLLNSAEENGDSALGIFCRMASDTHLWMVKTSTADAKIIKRDKATLAEVNNTGGVWAYNALNVSSDFLIASQTNSPGMDKIDKSSCVVLERLVTSDVADEIDVGGTKVYALYIDASGTWLVSRYDYGDADHDPIVEDWTIAGPNDYAHQARTEIPSGRGIFLGTYLFICLSNLYVAYLDPADGSIVYEETLEVGAANDLVTCVEAEGKLFSAGRKGGRWYVQARNVNGP